MKRFSQLGILILLALAAWNPKINGLDFGGRFTTVGPVDAVLVEETGDRAKLSPAQVGAILDLRPDAWAKAHNSTYHVLDKDDKGTGLDALLAAGVASRELPVLVVARKGTSQILVVAPVTDGDQVLSTLKRYGGN